TANPAPEQDPAPAQTQDSALRTQDLQKHKRLVDLLRLSHLRLRFPIEDDDFRIPSRYDEDGERLYSIDELDDNFEPLRPFPNIGPKHQRAPYAAATRDSTPQPPDLSPKN